MWSQEQNAYLDIHKLAHYLNVKYTNDMLHHQHRPQDLSQCDDKVSFTQQEKLCTYLCKSIIFHVSRMGLPVD